MKNLKMRLGVEKEISFDEAKELVKNTEGEYDFLRLNESTVDENQEFETVQNRSYTVKKVANKWTKEMNGTKYLFKTEFGVYFLTMNWDFRHPVNFGLNQNNLSKKWRIAF